MGSGSSKDLSLAAASIWSELLIDPGNNANFSYSKIIALVEKIQNSVRNVKLTFVEN